MEPSSLIRLGFLYIFQLLLSESAWDGPYIIKSATGKCIDVHGPDFWDNKNGGYVQVWDCNDFPHIKWYYGTNGKVLRAGSTNGLCLDVHGPDYWIKKNGGKVQTWQCGDVEHQHWYFQGDAIKTENGMCLDVHGPDSNKNGGRIQVWQCLGNQNQKWTLERVDYEVLEVSFDYDAGKIVNQAPFAIGHQTCDNEDGGSAEHKLIWTVSKDVTHSSYFERTAGFELSIGAEFKTGIPFIAEGKISTTLTSSIDFTKGEETSTTKHYESSFELTCAPGEVIEGVASVFTAEIAVPYTITFKSKGEDIYFESSGIWYGQTSWELRVDFTKIN